MDSVCPHPAMASGFPITAGRCANFWSNEPQMVFDLYKATMRSTTITRLRVYFLGGVSGQAAFVLNLVQLILEVLGRFPRALRRFDLFPNLRPASL
jgi:hypothetical protein